MLVTSYPTKSAEDTKDKEGTMRNVTSTFLSGHAKDSRGSCTVIIANKIAKKYGIYNPTPILVEGTDKGILIRKIEI
jgi:hypothetical protein